MRNTLLAPGATAIAALLLFACAKKEAAPPVPAAAAATQAQAGTTGEGSPRIAIAPDGVHVQYHVYGSGEPALVFIHGWSCDSNYWREQVPELAKKYTVVTVDLAGHGGTDGARSDWSMARFGQDVKTALSAVPMDYVMLGCPHYSADQLAEAARLLEGRVIGIIGVDTFKTIGAPVPSKAQVDAIIKPFEADFIGHTRALVSGHFFAKGADPQLVSKIAYDMSLSPPKVAIPALRATLEYDFAEPLKDVTVPIVAINSDLGEPANEARIRKVLPKFHAVTLAGDGHFLMMEDPRRFNPALEAEIQSMLVGS